MIVQVGQEVQKLTGNLVGYLGVLGLSPRTYGFWAKAYAQQSLVASPPKPPSKEEIQMLEELRARMKDLHHVRHYTFGLPQLWKEVRGKVKREVFRSMAREVRNEVKRERRNNIQRYEFTHPDVCHSMDFQQMPYAYPASPKRYNLRILDECTRFTLMRAITNQKGAGVGARFVFEFLKTGKHPLLFKYDREFDQPQFENLLIMHKIVPLPCPRNYPRFNGKTERSNKDVKQWFDVFESDLFWSHDELSQELDICFERLDEIEERAMFGGNTRKTAYETMTRSTVNRDEFFDEVMRLRKSVLNSNAKIHPADAWRYAAKEALKRYDLVRYVRP